MDCFSLFPVALFFETLFSDATSGGMMTIILASVGALVGIGIAILIGWCHACNKQAERRATQARAREAAQQERTQSAPPSTNASNSPRPSREADNREINITVNLQPNQQQTPAGAVRPPPSAVTVPHPQGPAPRIQMVPQVVAAAGHRPQVPMMVPPTQPPPQGYVIAQPVPQGYVPQVQYVAAGPQAPAYPPPPQSTAYPAAPGQQ